VLTNLLYPPSPRKQSSKHHSEEDPVGALCLLEDDKEDKFLFVDFFLGAGDDHQLPETLSRAGAGVTSSRKWVPFPGGLSRAGAGVTSSRKWVPFPGGHYPLPENNLQVPAGGTVSLFFF
jgi:hypothetical protein